MIAMPNLIPDEQRNALSLAIIRGDTNQVRYLVEEYDLDDDLEKCSHAKAASTSLDDRYSDSKLLAFTALD